MADTLAQAAIVALWLVAVGLACWGVHRHAERVWYYVRFLAYTRERGAPADAAQAEMWVRDEWTRFQIKALLVGLALLNLWAAVERGLLPARQANLDPANLLELIVFLAFVLRLSAWTRQVDRDRAPARERAPQPVPAAPAGPSAIVYVCDDVWAVREYVTQVLERQGHSVVAFAESGSLFATLAAQRPDVVLVDVVLGRESGIAVAQRVGAEYPGVPVYLITGWAADNSARETRELVRQAGAAGVLPKPIRKGTLEELIAGVMAGKGAPPC